MLEQKVEVNALSMMLMSDIKLMELNDENKKDNQLQQLMNLIKTGWPANKRDIPKECMCNILKLQTNFQYLTSFSKMKKQSFQKNAA